MKEQKGGAIYKSEIQEEKTKAQKALAKAKANDKNKIEVRINKTTSIFIKSDQCPIKAKERFIKRMRLKNN